MSKRKKTPPTTEASVLEESGRRCCVCYALHRNFRVKKGQVAHLDHNPANFNFDNLCFLCQSHHDDYDAKRRQSKGLTLKEVKQYRYQLYETVAKWRESTQALTNSPIGSHIPLLDFFEETNPLAKTSTQGLKIVERQAGFRIADKKRFPTINLDIYFREEIIISRRVRVLHLTVGVAFGLMIRAKVCAYDDWTVSGFMNVLRNNLDIWLLHGEPLENDERDPMFQPRDAFLVYRTSDGENRLTMGTHTISESMIEIHARFSDRAAKGLANYLDAVGFTKPFKA